MTRLLAAWHELSCRQCRVTWRSWIARLLGVGGMHPGRRIRELPRGLVDMDVPPPHPTTTPPDAPYEDYDG